MRPSPASTDAPRLPARVTYVDGLRGMAIAMVLLSHAVWKDLDGLTPRGALSAPRILFDILAHEGYHGVSLFLVLSGFCLSYPALKRRAAGASRWFVPSEFFARRCLRILPPYYAALGLFVLLNILAAHHLFPHVPALGAPVTAPNVIAHVLLLHNLTPWYPSLNGAFWSLGLEWQWYWAFPLLLLLTVRSPRLTLLACLLAAMLWHSGTHDLWQLWNGTESGALPARLFEFCCGIAAASLIVHGWSWRGPLCPLLAWLLALPLLGSILPPGSHLIHTVFGQPQPLYGVAFGALILLGYHSQRVNLVLSWRPLVWLGGCSYSVYLIHQPVMELVQLYAPGPLQDWRLSALVGIVAGISAGWVFHLLVERPCLRRSTWHHIAPALLRAFRWMDAAGRSFDPHRADRAAPAPIVPQRADAG